MKSLAEVSRGFMYNPANNTERQYVVSDNNTCRICNGSGILRTGKWEEYNGKLNPIYTHCVCQKSQLQDDLGSNIVVDMGNYSISSWNNLHVDVGSNIALASLAQCIKAGHTFADNPLRSVTYFGGNGNGKTTMMACIANDLLDRGIIGTWISVPKFTEKVFASLDKNPDMTDDMKYSGLMKKLVQAKVLYLDDLGAAAKSNFTAEFIESVIYQRYNIGPTAAFVITTNMDLPDIKHRFPKTYSRIHEGVLCKNIAPDWRVAHNGKN